MDSPRGSHFQAKLSHLGHACLLQRTSTRKYLEDKKDLVVEKVLVLPFMLFTNLFFEASSPL